jgi:hypothetical protein
MEGVQVLQASNEYAYVSLTHICVAAKLRCMLQDFLLQWIYAAK